MRARRKRSPHAIRPRLDVLFHVPAVSEILSGADSPIAGGAETQIYLIARALARSGLLVGLLCYRTDPPLPRQLDGMTVIARPRPQGHRRVVGTVLESIIVLVTTARVDAKVYVQRIAGLHTGLVALAARLRARRFVYSSASTIDFELGTRGVALRERLLFRLGVALASVLVVQTKEQAELCRSGLGIEPELIPSITEAVALRAGAREVLLWIGRADPCKRPLDFVDLACALPEARLIMVLPRQGADAEALAGEVEAAAEAVPNLTVLPGRSREQVAELIEGAAAVVSTSEYEGMPNVFLEAWARGVPVLALHHDPDGVIEREGLGGFAAGSPERLRELAGTVWRKRRDQHALSARCRKYIERVHSEAAVAERWRTLLAGEAAPR